jgi:hypothetical protein
VTNQLDLWRDSIVQINTPIKVAIERLSTIGIKIVLVLDDDHRLLGTICDGDFRRGMLNGLSLEDPVEKIMNKNPRTVNEGTSRLEILKLMNLPLLGYYYLVWVAAKTTHSKPDSLQGLVEYASHAPGSSMGQFSCLRALQGFWRMSVLIRPTALTGDDA